MCLNRLSWLFVFGGIALLTLVQCRTTAIIEPRIKADLTIAFGSCNEQDEEQPIWKAVIAQDPDIWLWLGDIIYADTEDMQAMAGMYEQQKRNVDYQQLIQGTKVFGIWDDHDYGANNAGKEYFYKIESKENLFNFLDVPLDHPSRSRLGAYQAYTFDEGDFSLLLVLLDVRYFRDEPETPGASILGDRQWDWLTQTLAQSQADMHVIGGGIQFLPEEHIYEKWSNFPGEKERLVRIIDSLQLKHPLLISGDRHFSEIMREITPGGIALYEFTSSGLTHTYEELVEEPNRYRIGDFTNQKSYGMIRINFEPFTVDLFALDENNHPLLSLSLSY